MVFTIRKLASMALAILSTVDAKALVVRTGPPKQPSCVNFTPFVYAGCFKDDSSPRTLLYSSGLDTKTMTVGKCVAFCKGNEYKYAGLEYYGECYCGATVNALQIEEKNCNFPCNGNKTESCGGGKIISIYQDPTFPVVSTKTISDYMLMGCYSEGPNGRTLGWKQDHVKPTTLTVEGCLTSCLSGGYAFAGVEFGRECYCGVVLGNGTVPLNPSECNIRCTGNNAQFCGGSSKLNLYVARNLESSEPCEEDGPIPIYSSSSVLPTITSTTFLSSSSSTSSTISTPVHSSSTGSSSLTSSETTSSGSSSTENVSITSSTIEVNTTPTTSSLEPSISSELSPIPITTTTFSIVIQESSSHFTSSTSSEDSSQTITSTDTPSSSGVLPNPVTTTTTISSSTEELSSSSTTSTTSAGINQTTSSSDIPSSSGILPNPILTTTSSIKKTSTSTGVSVSSTITSLSDLSSTSPDIASSSTIFTTSVSPFTTSNSLSDISTTASSSSPSSNIPTTTTYSTNSKTIETCTSYYTICPPLPSPTCAYKLGKWCAKPIPEFNDTFTCLKSFASCVTQLSACFSQAGYPELLKCNQFNEYCSQIANYCDDFRPGKRCTLSSCRQDIPPYGVPIIPTQTSGAIFSSLYICPPFTSSSPTIILPTPSSITSMSKSTSTPAIPTYTNICTQPNNPAQGYGTYSPVGGIPLPVLSCNNDYLDYITGHPFKLYTSSDTYACPSYKQSGISGPYQGCVDACSEQFKLCNAGYAVAYKGYRKFKRGGSDDYVSACQKCKSQRYDCYLVNKNVSGGQECKTFNKGY